MFRSLFILAGVLFWIPVWSQQKELDSALQMLKQSGLSDTSRLNLLLTAAFDYSFINPDRGLEMADSAIRLSQTLHRDDKRASGFNYKGVNYQLKGQDSLAIYWFKRCLEIRTALKDSLGMAKARHNLGISYFNRSGYVAALKYYETSLSLFKSVKNIPAMAASQNSLGVVYFTVADYPRALASYYHALKTYEEIRDSLGIGNVYTNLGLVQYHLHHPAEALEYDLKALALFRKMGNRYYQQQVLGNIGNVYDNISNPKQALSYYRQSLDICTELGMDAGKASALANMGSMYNKLADFPQAYNCSKKALVLYKKSGNQLGAAFAFNQIGNIIGEAPSGFLKKKGIPPKHRNQLALAYYQQSLNAAQSIGTLDAEGEAWKQISQTRQKTGDYAGALQAYKKYSDIKDSLMNDQKKTDILRLEMQYEFDRKESARKFLQDQREAAKTAAANRHHLLTNMIITVLALMLLAGILIFLFHSRKRSAELRQKEAELNTEIADTEMKALRSQMNPHFIFNSLNSINDFISKNDTGSAKTYLIKFSSLMRLILENSEYPEVSLAEDLQALKLYMELEALRLKPGFTYEIVIGKQIDTENLLIAPMILQPFVENSIWHGISGLDRPGKIRIEIRRDGDLIHCIVEDNGRGRNQEAPHGEKRSLGMKITYSRIRLINKRYPFQASMELSDLPQGTRAELRLPLTSL